MIELLIGIVFGCFVTTGGYFVYETKFEKPDYVYHITKSTSEANSESTQDQSQITIIVISPDGKPINYGFINNNHNTNTIKLSEVKSNNISVMSNIKSKSNVLDRLLR